MSNSPSDTSVRDTIDEIGEDLDYRRMRIYFVVLFFVAFFIVPLETGLMTAFKSDGAVARTVPFLPPLGGGQFSLDNLQFAFNQLEHGLINSLAMALPATIINLILASMAAYGLTLVDWRGQVGVFLLFVVGIFVPYQAVIVPLADFWNNIFPLDSMIEPFFVWIPLVKSYHMDLVPLIITHVAYGIPIITLLFRSYYQDIPDSLIEAAKIDGKSITRIYGEIVLPLSKPMFGVVFIYQFTQIYNEFLFSLTLITFESAPEATVTLILPGLGASTSGIDFGIRMAAAFFAALPTLLLYVAFSEEFAQGLQTGGA